MKGARTYHQIKSVLTKNRKLKHCLRALLFLVIVAILAPVLANDKPLFCKYKDTWLFPAFSWKRSIAIDSTVVNYNMGKDWKYLNADIILFPPCAWSPGTLDLDNAPRKSPFDAQWLSHRNGSMTSLPLLYRHWLGTTQNGQDVLSILIHGTAVAIGISFASMLIATLIGLSLGAFAGYFSNNGLRLGPLQLLALITGLFFTYFYCCVIRGDKLAEAFNEGGIWLILRLLFLCYVALKTIGGLVWIAGYIERKLKISYRLRFPMDSLVSRIIELLNSVPALLLVIALSAFARPSYSLLIIIMGLLGWTLIARITRAEYLKAKNLEYVIAAKALGMKNRRILFRHILPNVMPVILVQVVFGMGSAVLVEASLSFLGIGVPVDSASWGSLLNEGRDHFSSWWLVVFPGACLCILMLLYNRIAAELSSFRYS
jgi:peptide/nickel transport system permease protein